MDGADIQGLAVNLANDGAVDRTAFNASVNRKRRRSRLDLQFCWRDCWSWRGACGRRCIYGDTCGGRLWRCGLQFRVSSVNALRREVVGVSPRMVQDAKRIHTLAPDLFACVSAGTMTIMQANRELAARGLIRPKDKTAALIRSFIRISHQLQALPLREDQLHEIQACLEPWDRGDKTPAARHADQHGLV